MTHRWRTGARAAAVLTVLVAAPTGSSATPVRPRPSAAVVASTYRAGGRPVALTLKLRYEMQCGWPGPGPLTIRLPEGMLVPAALPASAVLVDGKQAVQVGHRGHRIVIGLPPRPQIMCDVIGPGALTISFTSRARLGNPTIPGTYRLGVTKGSLTFQARLTIRPR